MKNTRYLLWSGLIAAALSGYWMTGIAGSKISLKDAPTDSPALENSDVKELVKELRSTASPGVEKSGSRIEYPPIVAFPIKVELDQESYSWAEAVYITVWAPAWNSDPNRPDVLGDGSQGAVSGFGPYVLSVKTGECELKPYRLRETGANTGIFTGEVRLSGFYYDAGDDAHPSLACQGKGPNDGALRLKDVRKGRALDEISVSFQALQGDGEKFSATAKVQWHAAEMSFLEKEYHDGNHAVVRLKDMDRNIDSRVIDTVRVRVYSEVDEKGIMLTLTETNESTGVFEATVGLSSSRQSGGSILKAAPGFVYAEYMDKTLPANIGGPENSLLVKAKTSFSR